MSDEKYLEPKNDEWNDAPGFESSPPQEELPPRAPAYGSLEELERLRAYKEPAQPEVHPQPEDVQFSSESEFTFEPTQAEQPAATIFDPVLDESEPYSAAYPQEPALSDVPDYRKPAQTVINHPPTEKNKNRGWIIALIVLLVLCLCVMIMCVVVFFMLASGNWEIQWTYQLMNRAMSLM